ncbi:MAG: DNA-protecting protein DprA, partial [Elusimicrobia bacterium]|nr:DNA-protecting protein DprA [Elusimicrobiota bacterium]
MRSSPYSSLSPRDLFIVLNAIPCLGNRKALALASSPEALEALDHLAPDDLARAFGISAQAARNISHFPVEDFLRKETDAVREKGFSLMTWADAEYPKRLREIPDPPVVLYFSGKLPGGWERSLAIVGSRNPTLYGLEMARRFGRELAEAGFIVVSGLARGIDRVAHEGCLEGGRPTIAVLGCGLDVNYPRDHAGLFLEISSR